MTEKSAGGSFGKSVKELWNAPLLIVPVTIGWIWF
jgi:hypothetical protein